MRRGLPLLLFVSLVLAGSAAAAGPPTGAPLGPPVKLPTPKPGRAVFAAVTVTGTLKPGVTNPQLYPLGYGRPPANLRVVVGQTARVISHGKVTQTFYFAIGDVSKPAPRLLDRAAGGAEVDFFGTPTDWLSPTETSLHTTDCQGMTDILKKLKVLKVVYGLPGDRAYEMWKGAWSRALCHARFTLP